MSDRWHVITGEYPPQPGGVSDYSQVLVDRLGAEGDDVHVWTAASDGSRRSASSDIAEGATVHRMRRGFRAGSLGELTSGIQRVDGAAPLLVQYVPQAFGYRGMNVLFCMWLARRRQPVWTMFHEVIFPRMPRQPARHRLLAAVTRIMAAVVVRSSERVFVSTPAWGEILRSLAPGAPAAEWLPVPSTIARCGERDDAVAIGRRYGGPGRRVVGHFGSRGPLIADQLSATIPALLERSPDASMVLLGDDGAALRRRLVVAAPTLAPRLWATGPLTARDVSLHLLACDLMLQPFEDGVTTRRTSVMAALAHGVPTVTTSGRLTEPLWRASGAVELAPAGDPAALATVAADLLAEPRRRERLGVAGRAVYDELFDVRHTVAALRRRSDRTLQVVGAQAG